MNELPVSFDQHGGGVADGGRRCHAGESCRSVLMVEIGNFAVLRRLVGRERAYTLSLDVAARIAALVPNGIPSVISPSLIEIASTTDSLVALREVMTALEIAFDPPLDVDGQELHVDLVLGAAITTHQQSEGIRLIEEAERALAEARVERVGVVRDLDGNGTSIDRIALSRDLGDAIANGQMFLQYQPKIHLRRQRVTSVEALIRWKHPVRGLISPADFIPLAEESRDIVALTLWTIRQVIADQSAMAERGHHQRVFINIAAQLLADPRFVRRACALVQAGRTKIGFEITETSVIRDPDSAISHLKMFADMGIAIAIDDYGAGLSSLAYLKKLPARELKIDKLFVTQITSSNRDPLIVRSTIDLAHALDMEVVAEGVETQSALALLSVMGCDMAQGYLISRPLDLDKLIDFFDADLAAAASERPITPFSYPTAAFGRA